MSSGITEAPAAGIGKLIMDNRFAVPNHQRDYSWTEDEIRQLFDDIEAAMEKTSSVYFLGLMVFLNTSGGRLIVLDGQQRIATAVIVFSAIRSWLAQYSEYLSDAQKIQEWFIGRSELGQKNPEPRLTMNSANDKTFNDYVIKSVAVADMASALQKLKKSDRNRKLLEAVGFAHERVTQLATSKGNPEKAAEYLFKFVNFMRDKVSVVKLSVATEEAAYTIFETLNDRGLDLSPLDLVKNHLFSKADEKSADAVRDMEERWAQMMATLSSVRPDNFLKAFWTMRHGRIRSVDLFSAFKKEYTTPDAAIDLSVDMLAAAEQYAAIDSADDAVWSSYSNDARQLVRGLRIVGSQQTHPVILAALNRFSHSELTALLKLLEVVIVRYLLIGGGHTGRFETTCAILARRIHAKEVKSASAAFQELKDFYPPDDEFKQAFRVKQERSNQKLQYLLRKIEQQAILQQTGKMAELVPGDLTVEHVLPRNPGADWAPLLKADTTVVEDCAARIGNVCLLTDGANNKLGTKSFDEKKKVLAASKLITTLAIADHSKWDRKNIDHHQAYLAKLAASAWRFT
ncbi:DUF262 domain-containing protein [Bradyrhizobium neotropicale]|uniref:DUF262 domain-containing protein n=1 Tax=Bradyrhizobium neotropicale TaxID=1497615 RepID=UPI001AD6E193|nr:DUF262 domain-containing protein [Bradyrhizobium neotropicale]MBO4224033.1 DUF262 domain-containing protein [Bradyrhizobium neotropicale]